MRIDSKKGKVQTQYNKKASPITRAVQSKNNKKACIDRRLVQSRNKKVLADVPLRRSARRLKIVTQQKKKIGGRKKGKQVKSKKVPPRKSKKSTSWQKKRTHIYRSYWLRGLLLSKKPNDERVMHFRRKKLLLPSEDLNAILTSPKCSLCSEAGYTSTLIYISCEICGGNWFTLYLIHVLHFLVLVSSELIRKMFIIFGKC